MEKIQLYNLYEMCSKKWTIQQTPETETYKKRAEKEKERESE